MRSFLCARPAGSPVRYVLKRGAPCIRGVGRASHVRAQLPKNFARQFSVRLEFFFKSWNNYFRDGSNWFNKRSITKYFCCIFPYRKMCLCIIPFLFLFFTLMNLILKSSVLLWFYRDFIFFSPVIFFVNLLFFCPLRTNEN